MSESDSNRQRETEPTPDQEQRKAHCCPKCKRTFETKHALFTHYSDYHNRELRTQECADCETEFYADYAKRYCSRSCQNAKHTAGSRQNRNTTNRGSSNPNYRSGKTTGTCELCDAAFEYYPSDKPGRYCPDCVHSEDWQAPPRTTGEDNPRWRGGKQQVECVVCGTTVERYPSNIGKITVCSQACRSLWLSESFTGPGHPNWKGGGNEAYGKGWNAVRQQALARDDYQCRVCGATRDELGRNPDVHHIVPVRSFIDSDDHEKPDAHSLDNVVSLCISCHRKADFEKISRDKLRALITS